MKNKIKSKIIIAHSPNCFMKDKEHPFSGIIKGSFIGNYNANKIAQRGRYHIWYNVTCNDPKCPAIKAVHSCVLVEC